MVLSLLHLGNPLGAYRALGNLKSSWLSREIACLGVFFALVFIEFAFPSMEVGGKTVVGWAAVGAGALCLFSMASIYSHTAIPAWNGWYTHISFHSAAAILGAALYFVAAIAGGQAELATRGLILVATGTGIQLVALIAYLPMLAEGSRAKRVTSRILSSQRHWLVMGQLLTVVGGLGLPLAIGFGAIQGDEIVYGILLLSAVGQLIGRSLFYVTGVHAMLEQH